MKQKKILSAAVACVLLFSFLFLPGCGKLEFLETFLKTAEKTTADDWVSDPKQPEKRFTYGSFSAETNARLTEIAESYFPTAVQLALLDGDRITCFSLGTADRRTGREVTDDTKYRVASLSKLAAAMTFMGAQDRGVVDEDADISSYFGERCRSPYFPETEITPAMLMAHTAGYVMDGPCSYSGGLLSNGGVYLYTEPGTAYNYSNVGYGVLSCLLEHATDRAFNSLAQEYLFRPLGIDASFIYDELADVSDVGALYGEDGGLSVEELRSNTGAGLKEDLSLACGNLIISAKDYVKLLGVMMHGGLNVNGAQILSSGSVESMLRQRITEGTYGVAFGSQIQTNVIEGRTVYVHTGSAYGMFSAYVFDSVTKKAAVVLSTGEDRDMDPDSEVYYLCQDLIREVWNAQTQPSGQSEAPAAASDTAAAPGETAGETVTSALQTTPATAAPAETATGSPR